MDDDDILAQFTGFTSASTDRARQYLQITDNNLEQAVQLYFDNDGADLGGTVSSTAPPAPQQQPSYPRSQEVINLDSDDDEGGGVPMDTTGHAAGPSTDDDEAIARRMQEEMYGASGAAGGGAGDFDMVGSDVRAPMARTTETLADWRDDPNDMHAAVLEQLRARQQRSVNRPGIFNQQRPAGSIWDDGADAEARRRNLSRATAGASDTSSKTTMLAEMYRPPFEILSPLTDWQDIRDEGKEQEKWILVNVQDANIFDCQVLNRDVWKNAQVQETVRENFIFKQYNKDDPHGAPYVRYYFHAAESMDAYPHIAILDPRTGEQVKVWSGAPVPKAMDFLMQLHEFLDRYSLKANTRNPVATRKAEKRRELDVDKMTEDEMLEMAMRNSLEPRAAGPRDVDPDDLTRHIEGAGNAAAAVPSSSSSQNGTGFSTPATGPLRTTNGGQFAASPAPPASGPSSVPTPAPAASTTTTTTTTATPFSRISSTNPHTEPAADPASTTRIQFRHPGGRVIRRFGVTDPVRRLYEWLKAEPLPGMKAGQAFELVFMGRNLMGEGGEGLAYTVEEAGLKNGSVMVEFVDGEE